MSPGIEVANVWLFASGMDHFLSQEAANSAVDSYSEVWCLSRSVQWRLTFWHRREGVSWGILDVAAEKRVRRQCIMSQTGDDQAPGFPMKRLFPFGCCSRGNTKDSLMVLQCTLPCPHFVGVKGVPCAPWILGWGIHPPGFEVMPPEVFCSTSL